MTDPLVPSASDRVDESHGQDTIPSAIEPVRGIDGVFPAVPGYEILGILGRGGMGTVYRARHIALDRIVALKMISDSGRNRPEVIRRFLREMQAAAKVAHPNIVTVYDAGESPAGPYFTMECLVGADLAAIILRGPVPIPTAIDYVRQAALGLQHALDRGLVHRDVKPANLFVTDDGRTVKVLDLGLARLMPNPGVTIATGESTLEGTVLGTLDFVAPEQLIDASTADTRSDLYSLGCTLYSLLTGKAPYQDVSAAEKIARHLAADDPVPVERLRPDVSPALAAIVRRLMAKRPAERFQTPAEVATAFAALHAPGTNRPQWIIAAAVVIGLIGVIAVIGWQLANIGAIKTLDTGSSTLPSIREQPTSNGPSYELAPPPISVDADRAATVALLEFGFDVTVRMVADGKTAALKKHDPLPRRPFVVTRLVLEHGPPLPRTFVTNQLLPAIQNLRALERFHEFYYRLSWTEDEIERLATSHAADKLQFFESKIDLTERTLIAMKQMPELTHVQFRAEAADDALLERLKELPKLEGLRLDGLGKRGNVTLDGWRAITSLKLRDAAFNWPKTIDRDIARLIGSIPTLEFLIITTTTHPLDDLVPFLIRSPKLIRLGLSDTLTNDGLAQIQTAAKLENLVITANKKITPVGIAAFKAARPTCNVE